MDSTPTWNKVTSLHTAVMGTWFRRGNPNCLCVCTPITPITAKVRDGPQGKEKKKEKKKQK